MTGWRQRRPRRTNQQLPAPEQRTAVSSTIPEQATALNSSFDLLVSNLSGMDISANSSIGSPSQIFGATSYGSHSFSSPCGFGSAPTRTRPSYPLPNYHQDGSKKWPNLIYNFPEHGHRHGNTFICQGLIEQDHIEYQTITVNCSCPPDDYKFYELKIANSFEVPACFQKHLGRILLFREPVANFTARQYQKFGIAKSDNPGAKKTVVNALKAEAVNAERDLDLFFNYSIIVFSMEQPVFANRIFSPKSDFIVDSKKSGIHNKPEDNTSFKKDQYGLTLSWKIALAGEFQEHL
ncbi:unnamed protein product [Cylindrotheca closterium]|uniref:Uncharacterized protein n=1 Tax=Cylindrotheca closterium TaxID=2856 RepID=A0AAD2CCR2_9STRA|nr:unnamed protein product [Cylindrotheca closterium]